MVSIEEHLLEDAEREMQKLLANTALQAEGIEIEPRLLQGRAVEGITRYADAIDADIIVMGTQGANALRKMLIGSTTLGVIRESKRPVLAIPKGNQQLYIDNIVLAIDDRGPSKQEAIAPLLTLAQTYQSSIMVYHAETSPSPMGINISIDAYLAEVPHTYHIQEQGHVQEGIAEFARARKADLLCLIRHERGFFASLFHSSTTAKLAEQAEMPLLVLHD